MTMTVEAPDVEISTNENETVDVQNENTGRGHDFTKVRPTHVDLAEYVNAHSGLEPVTANQVRAILTLRTEFSRLPEQKAKREERRLERQRAASKYAGMNEAQKKAAKAAERAAREAAKLEARVAEAKARAEALANAAAGSGEDLAAAVEADQGGEAPRKISRRR